MRTPPIVVRDFLIDDEIFLGEPMLDGAFRLRCRHKHTSGANIYMLIENGEWCKVAHLSADARGGDAVKLNLSNIRQPSNLK